MNYEEFPHIFNKIIGYIIDTRELEEIKGYMKRIRGYNYRVYVGIVRERIELQQMTRINTRSDISYIIQSVERGYIELLRYLHKRGCRWDWTTCAYAAEKGQIECLKYIHENGCEYDKKYLLEICDERCRGCIEKEM